MTEHPSVGRSDASLSRNPPRLALGPDSMPAGHLCDKCEKREAAVAWGTANDINHAMGQWRCDVRALTEQLEFARERAALIPELERKLKEAIDDRTSSRGA